MTNICSEMSSSLVKYQHAKNEDFFSPFIKKQNYIYNHSQSNRMNLDFY